MTQIERNNGKKPIRNLGLTGSWIILKSGEKGNWIHGTDIDWMDFSKGILPLRNKKTELLKNFLAKSFSKKKLQLSRVSHFKLLILLFSFSQKFQKNWVYFWNWKLPDGYKQWIKKQLVFENLKNSLFIYPRRLWRFHFELAQISELSIR